MQFLDKLGGAVDAAVGVFAPATARKMSQARRSRKLLETGDGVVEEHVERY